MSSSSPEIRNPFVSSRLAERPRGYLLHGDRHKKLKLKVGDTYGGMPHCQACDSSHSTTIVIRRSVPTSNVRDEIGASPHDSQVNEMPRAPPPNSGEIVRPSYCGERFMVLLLSSSSPFGFVGSYEKSSPAIGLQQHENFPSSKETRTVPMSARACM